MTRCRGQALLLLYALFLSIPREVAAFQIVTFGKAEDMLIKSDNYPDRYPPGANVSWTWNHSGGNWGVVFLDFDLDLGMDGYGDGDLLQMSDGLNTPTVYRASNPPVVAFKSLTSRLHIRFLTDTQAGEKDYRGFQLRILYGNTESELERKITLAEVTKEKKRRSKESDDGTGSSTPSHVTTAVTLIVVFGVIIIVAVVITQRNKFRRRLRRQSSTTLRTGRAEMLAATARIPTTPTTPRSPTTPTTPTTPATPVSPTLSGHSAASGGRRPSQASFQRSNSQLDWSARAGLTRCSLQTQERSAQPNDYAPPEPTHQTNIKYTISHDGGAADISVSSTITTTGTPGDRTVPTCSTNGVAAGTTQAQQASGHRRPSGPEAGRDATSPSKLSVILDDSQELNGAGDFVDTIDHLDPIPMEAIRGKNLLPPNLRQPISEQDHNLGLHQDIDLNSASPPPYVTQTSSESSSCYENISQAQGVPSPRRKSSIYANQTSVESAGSPEEGLEPTTFGQASSNLVSSGEVAVQRQPCQPSAVDPAGDYAYLKQPDDGVFGNASQKQDLTNTDDVDDIFGDGLDKVIPVASKPNTPAVGRIQRLGSAYDIPPNGDDSYDIPPVSGKSSRHVEPSYKSPPFHRQPSGDDPYDIPPTSDTSAKHVGLSYHSPASGRRPSDDDAYDIPPTSDTSAKHRQRRGEGTFNIPPISDKPMIADALLGIPAMPDKSPRHVSPHSTPPAPRKFRPGNDPFDIPPSSDMQRSGDDPYDIPPSSDMQRSRDDPYDIPPSSDMQRSGDDPYDIPPSSDMQRSGDDPYDIPPSSDMQRSGDDPYDIPPSSDMQRSGYDPYGIPPTSGSLYYVPPRGNLDYVPTDMARAPLRGDSPYDIPPPNGRW